MIQHRKGPAAAVTTICFVVPALAITRVQFTVGCSDFSSCYHYCCHFSYTATAVFFTVIVLITAVDHNCCVTAASVSVVLQLLSYFLPPQLLPLEVWKFCVLHPTAVLDVKVLKIN